MLITSEDANIKASTSQLNMLNQELSNNPKKERRDQIMQQMEGIKGDIKESQVNKAGYLKTMGLLPDKDSTDTPQPVATPAKAARPPLNSFVK